MCCLHRLCPFQQWGPVAWPAWTRQALTMGVAGQWCLPGLCMVGSKSCSMCGREGGKEKTRKGSVLAVCWGYPVWAELWPVPLWGRGEVLKAGEQPSPGATPWLGAISPVCFGREALARATRLFLAKSVFPWYCQEVPGSPGSLAWSSICDQLPDTWICWCLPHLFRYRWRKTQALGTQPIVCVVWHQDSCCFLRKTHPGLPWHQRASGSWTIPTDHCLLLTSRCSPRLCPDAGPDWPWDAAREEAITGLMISVVATEADFCAVEISRKVQVQQDMKISEYWYVKAWRLPQTGRCCSSHWAVVREAPLLAVF